MTWNQPHVTEVPTVIHSVSNVFNKCLLVFYQPEMQVMFQTLPLLVSFAIVLTGQLEASGQFGIYLL